MSYFEFANPDHLAFLPTELREATDLELIAQEAEADVIGHYTRALVYPWSASLAEHPYVDRGDGTAVFLRGYVEDPSASSEAASAVDDAFLLAMLRTIARVVVWRIGQTQRDLAATSQGSAQQARSWRTGHDSPFPRAWDRDLRAYDTRPPAWGA